MLMKKFLFACLFIALPYHLFACALCALYTPSATVKILLDGTPSQINTATFEWHFSQEFVKTLLERYDDNGNKKIDPDELKHIQIILENYISKRHYLTSIEYTDNTDKNAAVKHLPIHVNHTQLFLSNQELIFRFTVLVQQPFKIGDEFSFTIEDKEGFFLFLIHQVEHSIAKPFALESNINSYIAFIKITDADAAQSSVQQPQPQTITPVTANTPHITAPQIQQNATPSSWLTWLKEHLTLLQKEVQTMMSQLKEKSSLLGYALFLGSAFLYGVLHAAGPGHGKTLVSSYLFASEHRYSKALSMAALIGIAHTFAAFILTVVIYTVFDLFFNAFFNNVTFYATKLSAVVIIAIVIYLGSKKIKISRKQPKIVAFSAHPFTCSCAACSPKSQSTEWGVVLSASIVPCPGTVAIFIFALSSGAYALGFLAALAMSFGMSSVIAIAAFSTIFLKKRFQNKSLRIFDYSEIIGLGLMLILGLLLLIA